MTDAELSKALEVEAERDTLRIKLDHLLKAAMPFAEHGWVDAELEDDNCRLTKFSGKVTVGHWRALRAAIASIS